jgi:hypothetical protein
LQGLFAIYYAGASIGARTDAKRGTGFENVLPAIGLSWLIFFL